MHAGEFLVKTKSGRAYLAVVGKSESAKSKSSKSSDYSNLNRNSTMGLGTGAMSQINPLSQEVGSEVPDEPRGPPKPSKMVIQRPPCDLKSDVWIFFFVELARGPGPGPWPGPWPRPRP